MAETVTAEELARRLGLSRATVSIVLRGDAKRRKISAATTERVLEAAKQYNYVPHQAARMLRRQRTDVIGVIFPNLRLDWAERIMQGMLDVLRPTRFLPFVATHGFNADLFRKEVLSALQRRDDALICFPLPGMNDLYEQVVSRGVPLVFLSDCPLDAPDANWVGWDAGSAASEAVRHLISIGRKRIGYLGVDFPFRQSVARYDGYRTTLQTAGLAVEPHWVFQPDWTSSMENIVGPGIEQMFQPGKTPPDALFALNDALALAALDTLRRRGLRVPEDVAVVSMGDLPMTDHSGVGLSTMHEPVEEMGREAAQVTLDLIADNSPRTIQRALPCNKLKARLTTIGAQWTFDVP